MRVAIITEEYDTGIPNGGFFAVREALRVLYPEARVLALRRARPPRHLWSAWRLALEVENLDLRGFDLVVTLGYGFAHGVITQPETRHVAYFFAPPALWLNTGFLGHWYRLWGITAAGHVDRWLANSDYTARALGKYFRKEALVLYPPVEQVCGAGGALRTRQRKDGFALVGRTDDPATRAAVKEACARSKTPVVFLDEAGDQKEETLLKRALWVVLAEPVSFSHLAVKALSAGVPTLCRRGGGLTEIITEGQAGLFFDDGHPGVIADGMRRMRERLPEFKPDLLRERAKSFSEGRFREEFLKVMAEVV